MKPVKHLPFIYVHYTDNFAYYFAVYKAQNTGSAFCDGEGVLKFN